MSTVFGCLRRRRVLLRFVGALSPEKHARHDFASRFWMCLAAWSVAWLRSWSAPLSEGAAALPWRVVCIWLACGRCLQCVARRLPRQRVWCVVGEGLNSASLARGRIAHSLPNAHAALVGSGGCWSVGGVCFTMTLDMVQLAFNILFRSGRHRPYGEARWFKQRLPLCSALGDIRGPVVAHASLSYKRFQIRVA